MFRQTLGGTGCLDQHLSPRRRASAVWRSGLHSVVTVATSLSAATLALFFATVSPAMADWAHTQVDKVHPAFLFVESNGEIYTTVADSEVPITVDITFYFGAGRLGRIRSFEVWTEISALELQSTEFKESKYSKTYSVGNRPKEVTGEAVLEIPYDAYSERIVEYCEVVKDRLRDQGLSDQQIFSIDRKIEVSVDTAHEFDMSGASGRREYSRGLGRTMTVVCKKSSSDAPQMVEAVDLEVVGTGDNTGACSLRLMTTIETKRPNADVWFRFESDRGQKSDLKTITTGTDASSQTFYDYDLPPGGGRKTGKVRIAVEGQNFTSAWADYEVQCGQNVDSFATLLPPKAEELHVGATTHRTTRRTGARSFICPARAKIIGLVKGRSDVSDFEAVLYAADEYNDHKVFDIEEGETVVVEGEHDLNWGGQIVVGDAPMQQSVSFRMVVNNALHDSVDQIEKTHTFTCEEVQSLAITEGLAGQIVANAELAHTKVEQQVSLTFAIIAPRSVVRNGQIHLSGVAADQVFKLSFQRKANGIYNTVHPGTAQVPQEMTGATASFSTESMEPGSWRLRVCPIRPDGQIAQGNDCRQSDFVLPKTVSFGTLPGAPGKKAPGPEPKTLHISPGLGN